MVWAMTGAFSGDERSKQSTVLVEAALKDIKERVSGHRVSDGKVRKEEKYVVSTIATMEASRRSLDIVYKGRQLNFEENEKLRSAYLDSVKESLDFGKKAKDFIKSLPTMTIGAAGGVTVAQAFSISGIQLWAIGLGLAAFGYIVNLLFVRRARKQTQMLYVAQDYERDLYYDQYVTRVSIILTSLYLDLDRIHKNVFGQTYPVDSAGVSQIIEELLRGVRPTLCSYVHKHMKAKKITPELWSMCESGVEDAVRNCPYWEAQKIR